MPENEQNITPNAPNGVPLEPAAKQSAKKSRIVLLIVAILVLVGGIIGLVFFVQWYNSPEKISLDAVSNLIKAKSFAASGSINIKAKDTDLPVKALKLDINNNSSYIPNQSDIKAELTLADNTKITAAVGEAVTRDGVIYFKLSGVKTAYQKIMHLLDPATSMDEAKTDDQFLPIIAKIDQKWWKVSIPELMKKYDKTNAKLYSGMYQCTVDTLADITNHSGELVSLYSKHQFVKITPYQKQDFQQVPGHNYYEYKQKPEAMAAFINAVPDTNIYKNFVACVEKIDQMPKSTIKDLKKPAKVKAKDLDIDEKTKEYNLSRVKNVLGIDKGRNFAHFYNETKYSENIKATTSLHFVYSNQPAQVEAPKNAHDIDELISKFMEM